MAHASTKRKTINTVEVRPAILTTLDAMFSIKREKEGIDFIPYPGQLACPNKIRTATLKSFNFLVITRDFLVLMGA